MTPELKIFVAAFPNEQHLRDNLETLFSKIKGVTCIRKGHSSQEFGKDLLFYEPTVLDRRLVACVVKNSKITGAAGTSSGARAVLIQAQQALDTPFINEKGAEEWVECVYVFSPYECGPETMNSIRGGLQSRHGQVVFWCGRRLYDLFSQHWPAFLQRDINTIDAYIVEMIRDLDIDKAVANALFRFGFAVDAHRSLRASYVKPAFTQYIYEFLLFEPLRLERFTKELSKNELRTELEHLVSRATLCSVPGAWQLDDVPEKMEAVQRSLRRISIEIEGAWSDSIAQAETEKSLQTGVNRAAISRWKEISAKYSSEFQIFDRLQTTVQTVIEDARRCIQSNHRSLHGLMDDPRYNAYSRALEIWHLAPQLVHPSSKRGDLSFVGELLSERHRPLLITAAPGYGKTSFCKWHAMQDAERVSTSDNSPIPIYVPLHTLASQRSNFDFAFLSNSALVTALRLKNSNRPLRLYLDGLDEIPSLERQRELILMVRDATERMEFISLVITARDHVSGPWLQWLTRIRLKEFTDKQVEELAARWLDYNDELVQGFMQTLRDAPGLRDLIRVPLLCALSVAVYKRINGLPPNRTTLYEMFISLLAGGWDAAKQLIRPSGFPPDAKMKAVTELAGVLHRSRRVDCTEDDVRSALSASPSARPMDAPELVSEAVRDGILMPVGDSYTFAHLSFQEFLAARQLHDPTGRRPSQAVSWFLAGDDWWSEVSKFYVTMTSNLAETEEWIVGLAAEQRNTHAPTLVDERLMQLKQALWGTVREIRFPFDDTRIASARLSSRQTLKPRIDFVVPSNPRARQEMQTLAIRGQGFQRGAKISVNGSGARSGIVITDMHPTSFDLQVWLSTPGIIGISITNPDGTYSDEFKFKVNADER